MIKFLTFQDSLLGQYRNIVDLEIGYMALHFYIRPQTSLLEFTANLEKIITLQSMCLNIVENFNV
jgi:hypothetical protein